MALIAGAALWLAVRQASNWPSRTCTTSWQTYSLRAELDRTLDAARHRERRRPSRRPGDPSRSPRQPDRAAAPPVVVQASRRTASGGTGHPATPDRAQRSLVEPGPPGRSRRRAPPGRGDRPAGSALARTDPPDRRRQQHRPDQPVGRRPQAPAPGVLRVVLGAARDRCRRCLLVRCAVTDFKRTAAGRASDRA